MSGGDEQLSPLEPAAAEASFLVSGDLAPVVEAALHCAIGAWAWFELRSASPRSTVWPQLVHLEQRHWGLHSAPFSEQVAHLCTGYLNQQLRAAMAQVVAGEPVARAHAQARADMQDLLAAFAQWGAVNDRSSALLTAAFDAYLPRPQMLVDALAAIEQEQPGAGDLALEPMDVLVSEGLPEDVRLSQFGSSFQALASA